MSLFATMRVCAQTADTVIITGNTAAQASFDAPASVSTVDAATLQGAGPMVNLSESMNRVPGLIVNLRNNYAQDLQISARGFGANAPFGVRGVRLFSDGIPAAGADGQGQVSHFDLAGADHVEVLRGPFSALYGSSSGGVIALVTRPPTTRDFGIAADQGSFGLHQQRLSVEAPFGNGLSLRAEASHFSVQGFRPNSEAKRSFGNLRFGWEGQGADRVVVVVNAIDQPAQDPLGLTRAEFNANPRQNDAAATTYLTRKTLWQNQGGLQWAHRFEDAGPLVRSTLMLYSGERDVWQWQAIPVKAEAAPTSPGGVVAFDRYYGGIDARLFWRWDRLRLVTGFAQDAQRENREGYNNYLGSGGSQLLGVTGALRKSEDDRVGSLDGYAQGEFDLTPTLTASAGVRSGRLKISSRDKYLVNGDDSGSLSFSYTLPVLALRWEPTPDWNLYLSGGRGYQTPTLTELAYRPDASPGLNTALRPQRSQQWELGAKWHAPEGKLHIAAALFHAAASDEIGVLSSSGGRSTYQNVGHTLRQGAEASLAWQFAPAWRADIALTALSATYRDDFLTCTNTSCPTPTVPVSAGNRIAGTMPHYAFGELVWSPGAAEFGIEMLGRGPQAANDVNSDFAGGYGLLALRAQWQLKIGPGSLQLLARVDDLANRSVAGSVIVNDSNQRFFEPAAGRTALLSLRWREGF